MTYRSSLLVFAILCLVFSFVGLLFMVLRLY